MTSFLLQWFVEINVDVCVVVPIILGSWGGDCGADGEARRGHFNQ